MKILKHFDLVKQILEKIPRCRDHDEYLYHEVLTRLGFNLDRMTVTHFLKLHKERNIPKLISIIRARNKVQELHLFLHGKKQRSRTRAEREVRKEVIDFIDPEFPNK